MRKISTTAVLLMLTLLLQAQVPDTLIAIRDAAQTTRMSVHTNGGMYVGGTSMAALHPAW